MSRSPGENDVRTTAPLSMLVLVAGSAIAGFAAGWAVKPSSVTPPVREGEPDAPSAPLAGPMTPHPVELAAAPSRPLVAASPVGPSSPGTDASIDERLRTRLGGDPPPAVVARANAIRRELLAMATASASESASREELSRREALKLEAAGEMPRFLAALRENHATVSEVAADGARMRALLTHPAKGPRAPANDLARLATPDVEGGTTLLLPEGKFAFPRSRTLAAGLTISGLGVDRTFVDGELNASDGSLLSLTIEDLTLTGQDVFDAGKVLTLTLRRVRAAGYNSGAGGSSFLDVRSGDLAILCEECVFDGVVGSGGRAKGPERHGTPFSLSAAAKLLRFERCTFLGNQEPVRTWGTSTIHFERCTFRGNAKARVDGAVYVDCVFQDNGDDAAR